MNVDSATATAEVTNGEMNLNGSATVSAEISALSGTATINFNGSNISDESTPKPIKFLPKLSLVRCCVEINQ